MTDESYIALICNGGFDIIPDISIGELFEIYFDNLNYNVIREGKRVFVDFTGTTLYDNKEENLLIRFFINPNNEEFAITEVKVGNQFLEEDDIIELLDDIEFVGKTFLADKESIYNNTDDLISDENNNPFMSDFELFNSEDDDFNDDEFEDDDSEDDDFEDDNFDDDDSDDDNSNNDFNDNDDKYNF